ncbi:phage major capsid protein [Saccharothrix sp. NRRL B-16348]|uniref:phage major capsid protein n=1 Tax=Saccharothrix sp. NRRL B-16348 TaxID=1415542 RepID=UPI0018D08AF8|nr:phage major capsid protein [Saccharothrix sp. NRRL B-16348]
MQSVLDEAGENSLTDEQCARYEALEGDLKRAQKSEEIQKRNAAYNSVVTSALHVAPAKEDDTLERAFMHYARTGQKNSDITELRAQSVGTDSAGGYAVPTTLLSKMTERLKAFGGVASVADEITTSSGEPLTWVTLDDTANAGVIAAEGTAPASGGADLVFGEKTLGAFKYVAPGASNLPLRVSVELLQDANFNVQSKVFDALTTRIARQQAVDWVTGTGTTEPFGVNTGTAGTAFTSAGITYAELVDAVHGVDPAYRASGKCVWTFNDATLALIEKLVDGNSRPLLNMSTDGISGAPSARLLGFPVVIDQAWATYTDGGTNKWGAFGDLNAGYIIRRVSGFSLVVDPYTRVNEGQVQYSLHARADAVVQDANAFRVLINAV